MLSSESLSEFTFDMLKHFSAKNEQWNDILLLNKNLIQ